MGIMRFRVSGQQRVPQQAIERTYIAGLDCIPTPAETIWEDDATFHLSRTIDESGNLYIPWSVEGHGQVMLVTGSLMERERPYRLSVELARGTVNRVRTKAALWQSVGLIVPERLRMLIRQAVEAFTRAATSQHAPEVAEESAEQAIRLAVDASVQLGNEYARQVLHFRHESAERLGTLLAGNLGNHAIPATAEPMFGAAFNTAIIPLTWRVTQAEQDNWNWSVYDKHVQLSLRYGWRVIGGPLLHLDPVALPDWILGWGESFENLAARMQEHVAATVNRFRGKVHLWHCVAGINTPSPIPLTDEQKLRLTVQTIDTVRRLDPRTPVMVSVDQPWAEYMVEDNTELSPLHFAEMLVRADLGITGVGLEINLGYWPGGSQPRDILEFGQHVDQWSMLGLPLIAMLTLPSSDKPDSLAHADAGAPLPAFFEDGISGEVQKEQASRLIYLLLAKQSVHGVVWNQVFDSVPHKYAHGGIFGADDMPKPILSSLLELRRKHLE